MARTLMDVQRREKSSLHELIGVHFEFIKMYEKGYVEIAPVFLDACDLGITVFICRSCLWESYENGWEH